MLMKEHVTKYSFRTTISFGTQLILIHGFGLFMGFVGTVNFIDYSKNHYLGLTYQTSTGTATKKRELNQK